MIYTSVINLVVRSFFWGFPIFKGERIFFWGAGARLGLCHRDPGWGHEIPATTGAGPVSFFHAQGPRGWGHSYVILHLFTG